MGGGNKGKHGRWGRGYRIGGVGWGWGSVGWGWGGVGWGLGGRMGVGLVVIMTMLHILIGLCVLHLTS